MAKHVPLVDYLVLEPEPHLVAHECTACGARYFDRRNACANCFGTDFRTASVANTGELRAFTIVSLAAPGIPVPFVAGLIDCEGTSVRANVVNVEPDPDHVHAGVADRRGGEAGVNQWTRSRQWPLTTSGSSGST